MLIQTLLQGIEPWGQGPSHSLKFMFHFPVFDSGHNIVADVASLGLHDWSGSVALVAGLKLLGMPSALLTTSAAPVRLFHLH